MKHGSVRQRHTARCPRGPGGQLLEHRCRGNWEYVIDAGRDNRGRRRQLTRGGFSTRSEARSVLMVGSTHDVDAHRLTVDAYLRQWMDSKRALRPSTRKSYQEHIDLYLGPHLGQLRLQNLSARNIDAMISAIMRDDAKRLSSTTVRRIHATLRSALNAAVRRQLMSLNPALQVELPRQDKRTVEVWTPGELKQFLAFIQSDRLYALYHLVALTGLRRGEVLGLRWVDVDLERRLLSVNQQIVQVGRAAYVGPPKTSTGRRVVPLDTGTAGLLQRQYREQQRERELWGGRRGRTRDSFSPARTASLSAPTF